MTKTAHTIAHGSFTVERHYPAAPTRVFNAFADPEIKGKWYGDPEKDSPAEVFEFSPRGREVRSGVLGDGTTFAIESRYFDIVENQRIVYAYGVVINGARTSVSVATVELMPDGTGTHLTMTEHGAFLDGIEVPAERQGGAEFVLDRLGVLLAQA